MKKFRKVFSFLLSLCCILQLCMTPIQPAKAASIPSVSAHAYVIMDASTGKVLYSYHADQKLYPASTVKLMTALVVLDRCSLSKKITVTKKMLRAVPAGAAKAGLKAGSSYTVYSLLHMLLLPSAADAAIVLAQGSYGSTKAFVAAMNRKAKSLSMTYSSFDNPIGLDIGNNYHKTYATAREFANLARYAMSKPTIRAIVSKPSYVVPSSKSTKAFTIRNTNQFLSSVSYNKNLYQMVGGKTGTTNAAGCVLITTAKDKNGHEIICAFFGNSTHSKMYSDMKALIDYTFKQGKKGNLNWKKCYWDVRYRDSEARIRTYYTNGLLPVADRFYPTKKATQRVELNLINRVSEKTSFTSEYPNKKLSVLEFANILYNTYHPTTVESSNTVSGASVSANNISTAELALYQETCQALTGTQNCSSEDFRALAFLIDANLLPENVSKNVNTSLTKEEAVYIGDKIRNCPTLY